MIEVCTNQIPVTVTPHDEGTDVYIPDMCVTVHGSTFTDAMASAAIVASAIYYYSIEHNTPVNLKTTYEDVEEMCSDKITFPTFLGII